MAGHDVLGRVCGQLGAIAGTLHRVEGQRLILVDARAIPPGVRDKIQTIPMGKGMAGQAWATGRPTQTCDLSSDPSTVIQPGARNVEASAAVAVPIFDDAGTVWAVLGVGFSSARPMDAEAIQEMAVTAESLFKSLLNEGLP